MVLQVMKCSDDFAPIGMHSPHWAGFQRWNAARERGRQAQPRRGAGSRTSSGACTHDNDLTMHDILDGQVLTSCVSIFDDVGDHHHHVFGLTVGESLEFFLRTLKVRFHQDFGVLHAAGTFEEGHQFIKVIIAEILNEFGKAYGALRAKG